MVAASLQRLLRATMELVKLSLWKYIVMPLEALFVTEKTLSSALDQLDANTMPLNNNDKMPDLEVTDMSDDQLTIQLSNIASQEKSQRTKKYSESSDDIEVIHSSDMPNLHSILKGRNRTVSESSDEVFGARGAYLREDSVSSILSTGSASEGLVSESEDQNPSQRKKTVSFSEYVDSTTYKSNASVSTLHASLKKKSKRFRKKEAKIERRRRRSSGSEHEHSSEEQSSQPETCESTEMGEIEDDDVINYQPDELPEEPKVHPNDDDEDSANLVSNKQSNKKGKKNKKKGKKQKTGKEGFSEANAASHTPPETRGDSVTSEEGESALECVAPEDGERTRVNGVNGAEKSVDMEENPQNEDKVNLDSDDNEDGLPPQSAGASADVRTNKRDPDAPETMLSWKNEKPSVESEDVTKCAFNFNNSVMFDLDDD